MGSHEKPADRGARRARGICQQLGRELHDARVDRGLSLDVVGRAVDMSASHVSRIERGLVAGVAITTIAKLLEVVGLELSARAYPGAGPVRDAAHVRLLQAFRLHVHRSIRWATEVPIPIPGDLRAWDVLLSTAEWSYGVEAETAPRDAQALERRIHHKVRDSGVDGVILVLPGTRAARQFIDGLGAARSTSFPIPGRRALELLAAGADPGGSAVVVVRIPPRARSASQAAPDGLHVTQTTRSAGGP